MDTAQNLISNQGLSTQDSNHAPRQVEVRQGEEPSGNDSALKCSKFFKTLLHLSQNNQNKPGTAQTVQNLVQDVIAGRIQPEDFTNRLQAVLGSHAQPRLIPFLHSALPPLRSALLNKTVSIDGINLNDCFPTGSHPQISSMNSQSSTMSYIQSGSHVQSNLVQTSGQFSEGQYGQVQTENGVIYQPINHVPMPISGIVEQTQHRNGGFYAEEPNRIEPIERNNIVPDNLPPMLLDPQAICNRLVDQMGGDCTSIDPEVFLKLSEVVESRLRDLMTQLSLIAEHRIEPLRMNPMYSQINEPRRQLRFVEEVEKQAFTRRQNLEREAWIKFSKSKTKDKDTVQKAKEIQRANQEENLNREANEAAIAALGGSRGQKRTWGQADPLKSSISSGLNLQMQRPRVRRVNMKDFLCALNGKGVQRNNVVKFLVAYGLIEVPTQNISDIN